MTTGKLTLLGGAAVALLLAACSENTPTSGPAGPAGRPAFVVRDFGPGDGLPYPEEIELCKFGSSAEFDVQMVQPDPPGPTSLDITLQDATNNISNCRKIGEFDAIRPADITITEVLAALPAGVQFDSVTYVTLHGTIPNPGGWVTDPPVQSTTNLFSVTGAGHGIGYVVNFYNSTVPLGGCSFTLGYWKTHTGSWPAGYDPNATFYTSGKTWIEVLNTPPPKGDAYYILAHQFIAATLNKANGAGVPSNVQTALTAAAAYFANPAGSSLTKTDLTNLASLLDSYNNGLQGVPHCG